MKILLFALFIVAAIAVSKTDTTCEIHLGECITATTAGGVTGWLAGNYHKIFDSNICSDLYANCKLIRDKNGKK